MSVVADLHPKHPINYAWKLLRFWLAGLIAIMILNAFVAIPILLEGPLRPIPYVVIAAAALIWWIKPDSLTISSRCTAIISVGLILRAAEILFFEDAPYRTTAATLWGFLGFTALGLGLSTTILIGRRTADIHTQGRP